MLQDLSYTASSVTVSQYSMIDKVFRLKNRIKSRLECLKFQSKLYCIRNAEAFHTQCESLFYLHIYDLECIYNLLDNNTVICNNDEYLDVYSLFAKYPKSNEDHSKLLLNGYYHAKCSILKKDPVITQFMVNFKKFSLKARQREMVSLLRLEAMQRYNEGWFFVFNTLTVGNEYLKEVFNAGSSVWSDYVRSVDRSIGISCFGSWREAIIQRDLGNEFHTYFAVVERGSSNGRMHIHVLHICRQLPPNSFDPNAGLIHPYNRCISSFRGFWNYGFSSPIAVRFNNSDAFGLKNWRFPVIRSTNGFTPIPCKGVEAIIQYISKYVGKELDKPKSQEVIQWRVRKSRNLGKCYLEKVINQMNENQLGLTMVASSWSLRMRGKPLPVLKLKIMALKRLVQIWKIRNYPLTSKSLADLMPREPILKLLMHMIQGKLSFSQRSFGISQVLHYQSMEGSNLLKLFDSVADDLFRLEGFSIPCSTYTGGLY